MRGERLDEAAAAARAFYCELLDGREISPGCFAVGGVFIETGEERRGQTAPLPVEDPVGIAARCWNAGYTVVADEAALAIGVLDPFGLRIEFVRLDFTANAELVLHSGQQRVESRE